MDATVPLPLARLDPRKALPAVERQVDRKLDTRRKPFPHR